MLETILLISPLIIGAVVVAVNSDAITTTLEKFRAWLSRKREDYSQRTGKVSRYFLTPSLSSLLKVTEWTDKVQNKGLRSGIRVTAYLYLFAIIVVVGLTAAYVILIIAVAILMIWLFLWLLGHMLGGSEERETREVRVPREQGFFEGMIPFGSTEKEKLDALFGEKDLEIHDDGTIHKPPAGLTFREKIGLIDQDGDIYDTRGFANRTKIGRIDEDENIKEY